MKKVLLAAIMAASFGAAEAAEFGVNAGYSYAGENRSSWGFTAGQRFGAWGVTGGFDRYTRGGNDVNRWSLVGSHDLVKLGPVTVQAKAGAAYVNPQIKPAGYAALVGVGAEYELTKQIKLTADYQYQKGQDRVEQFNGNVFSTGIKFAF